MDGSVVKTMFVIAGGIILAGLIIGFLGGVVRG